MKTVSVKVKTLIAGIVVFVLVCAGGLVYAYHVSQDRKATIAACKQIVKENLELVETNTNLAKKVSKLDSTQKVMGTKISKPSLKDLATIDCNTQAKTAKDILATNKTATTTNADSVDKFSKELLAAYKATITKAEDKLSKEQKTNLSKQLNTLTLDNATSVYASVQALNQGSKNEDTTATGQTGNTANAGNNSNTRNSGSHYTTTPPRQTGGNTSNTSNNRGYTTPSRPAAPATPPAPKPAPSPKPAPAKPAPPTTGDTGGGDDEWVEVANGDSHGSLNCTGGLYKWSDGTCHVKPQP